MKWDRLSDVLAAGLEVTRVTTPAGVVRAGKAALDLCDVFGALVESEDDADNLECDGPWQLVKDTGHYEPMLDFSWDSLGPMCSDAHLGLWHPRGLPWFVCWFAEEEDQVVAALDPLCSETTCAFLRGLLADNGESYGVELFGGLPSRTINHRSDLISATVVKQSYWDYMQFVSAKDASRWALLQDSVIGKSEEPDSLARGLQAIKDLKRLGTPPTGEAIRHYLGERKRAGAALSEEDRSLILDNYFATSYGERQRAPS